LEKDDAMKKLSALLLVCLFLAATVGHALTVEAVALRRFPVMKTEEAFKRLLQLLEGGQTQAASDYLKEKGLLMPNGAEVILKEVGCDGKCVKFQIKGDQTDFWTVLTMDGEKVFEYKK